MTEENNTPELDEFDNIALEETSSDIDDVLDDFSDDFEDEDFDDENIVVKKSGNKTILFLLIILLSVGGAGYFFLSQSLPFIGEKESASNSNGMPAPSIPPAPSINAPENAAAAPMPLAPPPMPTPIGPDVNTNNTSDDHIVAPAMPAEIIPAAVETMPSPQDAIENMGAPIENSSDAVISDIKNNEIVPTETPTLIDPLQEQKAEINTVETIGENNESNTAPLDAENTNSEALVTEEELISPVITQSNDNVIDPRIDELEQNIQALNSRLDELLNKEEAPSAAPESVLSSDDKETLNTLSQQMLQVTHRLDQLGEKITKLNEQPKTVKAKTKTQPAPKTTPPTAVKAPHWVLRSAQPGIAWLSNGNNSEMQRYSVGQNVSGFGVIQSVTQENGKWIVRSKNGVIKQ